MLQNLSSAAVVIGALRVEIQMSPFYDMVKWQSVNPDQTTTVQKWSDLCAKSTISVMFLTMSCLPGLNWY